MTNYTMDCTTGALAISANNATLRPAMSCTTRALAITGKDIGFKTDNGWYLTDTVKFKLTYQLVSMVGLLSDTVRFDGAASTYAYTYRPGAALSETVRFVDDINTNTLAKYQQALAETVRFSSTLSAGFPKSLSDTVRFHDAIAVNDAIVLADKLVFGDTMSGQWKLYVSLADTVQFQDALSRFFTMTLSDVFLFGDTVSYSYRPNAVLADTVFFNDAFTPKLLLRIDLADGVEFTDVMSALMRYDARLQDGVQFSVAFLAPDGEFTAWALNSSNNQVSEYTNWQFNSFAKVGNKYLGANDDGIFELQGPTDNGENIAAAIKSGLLALNGPQLAGIAAAYVGLRGSGTYILKVETGDGREYTYQFAADKSMLTTKVNLGKGLRANLFSFELISTGDDFDLNSIEFIPLRGVRRV